MIGHTLCGFTKQKQNTILWQTCCLIQMPFFKVCRKRKSCDLLFYFDIEGTGGHILTIR